MMQARQSFTLKMCGYKAGLLFSVVFFLLLTIGSIYARHFYGAIPFATILGVGGYVLLAIGEYVIDSERIIHRNCLGVYEIYWKDVCSVEEASGQINLIGSDRRLVVLPRDPSSGQRGILAYQFILNSLQRLGLKIKPAAFGTLKWHKGSRVV
jgi:hypothetical protein